MKKSRGIVLISILFTAIVIAMFVVAALATAPSSLHRSRQQAQRQAAERALRSGMDYAISRVRATPGGMWRAATPLHVQREGLIVDEGEGQVTGWVQDGPRWARFRLNFNHQDGAGGADGMNDAAQVFPGLGLSCNNLPFNQDLPVPGLTANGQADPQNPRFQLPPHCLLLSLEGCSGPSSLSGTTPGFTGSPVSIRAEMVLQLATQSTQLYDAVASATGNLDFVVQAGQNVTFQAVGAGEGRLRTKSGLSVSNNQSQGAPLVSPRGEIRTPANGNQVGATAVAANIGRKLENPSDGLYSIALNSAPQTGAGAAKISAGVYEVDLVNDQPQVKYYALSYADYKAQRLAGTLTGGTSVTLDPSIQLNLLPRPGHNGVEVHFTQDTSVEPVNGSLKGLAIVPAKGAFLETEAAQYQQQQQQQQQVQQQQAQAPDSLVYLALLANRIQSRLSAGGGIQVGAQNTAISDPTFSALLTAYQNGPGTLNTGGPDVYFSNGAITSLEYFPTESWDGLPGIYNYQLGSLQLAQHMWLEMSVHPSRQTALANFMEAPVPTGFGGTVPQDFDVGFNGIVDIPETLTGSDPAPSSAQTSTTSGLAVKDLKIKLERTGPSGDPITLRSPGEMTLAGMLEGKGGAVVAEGDLSLIGNGLDLEASQASANSINLYSSGNILIDGFAFDDSSSRYNPIYLKGVMYSWGDITINAGRVGSGLEWANFQLTGAMVAYGRDPADPSAAASSRNIQVVSRNASLTFDPAYMFNLSQSPVNPNSRFSVRAYYQK